MKNSRFCATVASRPPCSAARRTRHGPEVDGAAAPRPRWTLTLAVAAVLGSSGLATRAAAQATTPNPAVGPTDTVAAEDITPGTRGYGLSVFAGTAPERFEVEVLGLWRKRNPDSDFILARLSGHGLERSGVVAGMSGSPVFFDGRLAGAVSFGWSFSNEAIAGITPIGSMRALADLPHSLPQLPPPTVSVQQLVSRDFGGSPIEQQLARMARSIGGGDSNLLWASVGFSDTTETMLATALGQLAPAGSIDELPGEIEAGSSVAGVLIDGDLKLAFAGTVTERTVDDVLAFGHPFMGLGPLDLPMASAEIVTVVSSQSSSFKVANIGPVIGAFHQDRFAGMLGRIGAQAPTIPLQIRLLGEPRRDYSMRVALLPQMLPSLMATAVLQAIEAARQTSGDQAVRLAARIRLSGHDDLDLDQSFEGQSAAVSSAIYLLSLVSFIIHHPAEAVTIEGLEVDIEQSPRPDLTTLLAAHTDRATVRPGDAVELRLDLREYRGEVTRESMIVTIPEDTPSGPYYLFVGDGASVDALRLQIEPNEPTDLEGGLQLLRSLHSARDFVVLGVVPGAGLVVDGHSLPELPGSMRSIWKASGPTSARSLNLAIRDHSARQQEHPLNGAARIDLRVEPRAD